jgi:formate hydrogenlyase subunit 3/multisubunit Na+/H+ antiporter MnhD subunit
VTAGQPVLGAVVALGAAAAVAAVVVPRRLRAAVVGGVTAAAGAAGAVAGALALAGHGWTASLPWLLPLAGAHLAVDALSGLFMAVAGAVAVVAAVYGIGYVGRGEHGGAERAPQCALPLFVVALVLVPAAGSVSTFLVLWELMALASLLLVVAEHRSRPTVRQAGVWYAVMTHLGLVGVLVALVLFASRAHGETFAALRTAAPHISAPWRDTVFVLAFAGFASKAGALPLHAWLPRAHPEAPSHVSALMSAAMVNLGVYGVVRVGVDLLGGGPRWWGLLVLAVGALSAVYGVLQAAVAVDLKRLLAYSTMENMGLVLVGVGGCLFYRAAGSPLSAGLALAAALLHLVNHAAFKALGFTAAGSVLHATGLRDLDRLGGLRQRMPVTTGLFTLAALGAVALPPGNGFPGEWLLLQSLIHGLAVPGVSATVALPLALGAVALAAGLAAAAFVKALGVGFLARPRSEQAAAARESGPAMLTGMALAALGCVALAICPALLGGPLSRAVAAAGAGPKALPGSAVAVRLNGLSGVLYPMWLLLGLVVALVAVAGLARWAGARPRRRAAALWDCGGGAPTARMQYTATSFAEPLQRVFDDVLAPRRDLDVTHHEESAYVVRRVRYRQQVPDRVEHRVYEPVVAAVQRAARAARWLADGSVHRYLGYGLSALVVVLLALVVVR